MTEFARRIPAVADTLGMTSRFPLPSELPDATGWEDPTWYDRLAAWLRAGMARKTGLDPWSAGFLLFAVLFLCAGLAGWCAALFREASLVPLVGSALLLVPAERFLRELEVRLRPKPLPRIRDPKEADAGEDKAFDPAFWRALRRSGVNVRIARALHAGGIRVREDAARRTDAELLALPGVGPRTVRRLRAVLQRLQEEP